MNPFLTKSNYCIFYGYFFIVYSATENKGAEEIKMQACSMYKYIEQLNKNFLVALDGGVLWLIRLVSHSLILFRM